MHESGGSGWLSTAVQVCGEIFVACSVVVETCTDVLMTKQRGGFVETAQVPHG